jgi:murein DD-endopeptidase MepM/ murein hydrolase activator NlpD
VPDAVAVTYRLPWRAGVDMYLTQDCSDSCCEDHVGIDEHAWDFASGAGAFEIIAARGGTVTHLKMSSSDGCGDESCLDDANVLVIDHGDGTQSTYLHLQRGSLAAGVTCGAHVAQGQPLAIAGSTGWATGVHLHFEVSLVHPGAATCECGADGMACEAATVPWRSFWPSALYPTVPVAFEEWADASSCADRRIAMPASRN